MLRRHGNGNSAARIKAARHAQAPRPADGDEVIHNAVDRRLVKGAVVPEGKKIKLQRLAFQAHAVRNIINDNDAEIGLSGDWAERGEFRALEMNPVISMGVGVRERFQAGLGG